jgi:hypothetical protein
MGRGETAEIKAARESLQAAEREYKTQIQEARGALAAAERRANEATDVVRRAERAYADRVRSADDALESARTGQLIGAHGPVRLYSNRLETGEGTVELDAAIRASVEASGTRTEHVDSRETVLLLDTPRFDSVVRINPDDTLAVRELAAKINTSAKNAETLKRAHAQAVAGAEQALVAARADREAIVKAERGLVAVTGPGGALDHAREALSAAEADTETLDSARRALRALDPSASIRSESSLRNAGSARRWWRRRSLKAKAALVGAVVIASLATLGAVTSPAPDATDASAADDASELNADTEQKPENGDPETRTVELAIAQPRRASVTVTAATVTVRGFATPKSVVQMNGGRLELKQNRFTRKVNLRLGRNVFAFRARRGGFRAASTTLTIIRNKPLLHLRVTNPSGGETTVRAPAMTIVGRAQPGATVVVKGIPVTATAGRFAVDVPLDRGRNVVWVTGRKPGFRDRGARFVITRRLSTAEIAAEQARARQAFIDGTVSIPYNQLIKDPDSHTGTNVRYYGEILQIQESEGYGMMLLYVTDAGYDIWSDQIWVNYEGRVRGAEGDKLTVYGTVVGSKSYETQIGGETYVPEVDAKYITE